MSTTRRGPGRPRVGTKIQVLIPESDLAVVDELAGRAGTTRSDVIRESVADRVALETLGMSEWVDARADRAAPGFAGVAHEVAHAREVYAAELRAHPFTVPELCLIADVMNTDAPAPGVGQVTCFEVGQACASARSGPLPSPYGDRWGVDEDALLEKLRGLGPAADVALRYAVAAFWGRVDVDAADPAVWERLGFTISTAEDR